MAAPNVPIDFVVVPSITGTKARLHWSPDPTDVSTGATYTIERSPGDDNYMQLASGVAAPATAYLDSPLLPDHSYRYRMLATNGDGDSDYALPVDLRTPRTAYDASLADAIDRHNDF